MSHIGVPCCPILVSQNTETAVMSVSQRNSVEVEPLSSIVTWSAMQEGETFR